MTENGRYRPAALRLRIMDEDTATVYLDEPIIDLEANRARIRALLRRLSAARVRWVLMFASDDPTETIDIIGLTEIEGLTEAVHQAIVDIDLTEGEP